MLTGRPNPWARMAFLEAVERCVPHAITALLAVHPDDAHSLDAWATEWGFTDDWLRDRAEWHTRLWRDVPELAGRWQSAGGVCGWEPVMPPLAAWNPTMETADAYRARVEAHIATAQDQEGYTRTPTKLDGRHFEWLALSHVGGWTYLQIMEKYQDRNGTPDVSAVSRGVTETAALVGVTLRPKRGRKLSR
ncbi:hypothetical protein BH23ACI1_BH23ACI1_31190 [soil metagenome]